MPRLIKIQTIAGAHRRLRGLHAVHNRGQGGAEGLPVPPPAQFPCPFCTFWTTNESGRTRHILSTPSCRDAQTADVEKARKARKAAQQVGVRLPLLSGLTLEDAAGTDQDTMPWVRLDDPLTYPGDANAPLASTTPPPEDANGEHEAESIEDSRVDNTTGKGVDMVDDVDGAGDADDEGGDSDGECNEVHVEQYPDSRAGQPIDDSRAEPFDLRAYMRARGDFANADYFDIAKTLMTTKLTNDGREVHLKSRVVSSIQSRTVKACSPYSNSIGTEAHGRTLAPS